MNSKVCNEELYRVCEQLVCVQADALNGNGTYGVSTYRTTTPFFLLGMVRKQ